MRLFAIGALAQGTLATAFIPVALFAGRGEAADEPREGQTLKRRRVKKSESAATKTAKKDSPLTPANRAYMAAGLAGGSALILLALRAYTSRLVVALRWLPAARQIEVDTRPMGLSLRTVTRPVADVVPAAAPLDAQGMMHQLALRGDQRYVVQLSSPGQMSPALRSILEGVPPASVPRAQ